MTVYIDKTKVAKLEELLARKTRVEFKIEVDGIKEFSELNEILERKIDALKEEVYRGVSVIPAIFDFFERKDKIKRATYSNMKEELLTSRRPCESCINYNIFPDGKRITDNTIWCARYPGLDPTEDYEKIMECQETYYEPFFSDKKNQSTADILLRLALLNSKIEKLENGGS